MKFGTGVAVVEVMLLSCGGQSEAPSGAEVPKDVGVASGTRLEVRRWSHGDVSLPSSVYDTELGVECQFMVTRDGVERCLPAEFPDAEIRFSDPDCKAPVALRSAGCADAEFRYDLDLGKSRGCGTRTEAVAYEVVREIEEPSRLYWLTGDGDCNGSAADYPVEHFYELREVSAAEFVAAERVVVPRTEDLGTEMIVAKDGLRLPQRVIRLANSQPCLFVDVDEDARGQSHCLTGAVSTTDVLTTDDECVAVEELALHPIYDDDCGPAEVVVGSGAGCGVRPLFELGPEPPVTWYEDSEGECSRAAGSETQRLFEIGQPRRGDEYPTAQVALDGTGRLAHLGYFSQGTWLLKSGLWDRNFEARCYPERAADGKTYCLPTNVVSLDTSYLLSNQFADASCSTEIWRLDHSDCPALPNPRLFSEDLERGQCSERTLRALYEAVPFDGDVIYVKRESGECTPEARDHDLEYAAKGAEVAPEETLVELTLE
jgi:hypothetical protein